MKRRTLLQGAATGLLGLTTITVIADSGKDQGAATKQAVGAENAAMAEGEIRKVDKDAGKITIKHGPLTKLDMPAMTMVFRVKDPALLDQVKAGDKIKFDADKMGGAFTVLKLEVVQ